MAVRLETLKHMDLEPVDVAVVDSGIDGAHPDLAGRIHAAWSIEPVEDKLRPTARSPEKNNDRYGHGTAVAGLIATTAPNSRLVDLGVLGEDNTASGEALLEGFRFALSTNVKIINMSLACRSKFAPQLNSLCEKAYRNGQIIVAAKRNHSLFDMGFPAEFSSCVSVDTSADGGFLNLRYLKDSPIEFAAQGADLVTLAPGGLYTRSTGTSFATPIISGLCALLLGRFPQLSLFEIKSLLKHFSREAERTDPGPSNALPERTLAVRSRE